jgi:hypothetical protein
MTESTMTIGSNVALATSPWAGKAWGIDISRYQTKFTPVVGAIDFGIAKLGGTENGAFIDPMFANHVQSIYDCKAIPMAYFYLDANYWLLRSFTMDGVRNLTNEQHTPLQKIIEGMRAGSGWKYVKALFFDCEADTTNDIWYAFAIEDLRDRIVGLQSTGAFPKIPLGIYSRSSFINSKPALFNWVAAHPEIIVWTANYLSSFPGTYKPLIQHKTESLPTVHNPIWFGDNPSKPKKYRRFWQFHGSFAGALYSTCPEIIGGSGSPSALDLDVCEYTRTELHEALGVPDRLVVTSPSSSTSSSPSASVSTSASPSPSSQPPTTNVEERLQRLENWARNIGFKN